MADESLDLAVMDRRDDEIADMRRHFSNAQNDLALALVLMKDIGVHLKEPHICPYCRGVNGLSDGQVGDMVTLLMALRKVVVETFGVAGKLKGDVAAWGELGLGEDMIDVAMDGVTLKKEDAGG
jgi:hypothetical protein